jgi:histidinol phosphatase-like enzyme (inositol monophosphatase family)
VTRRAIRSRDPDLASRLSFAVRAARHAGRLVLEHYRPGIDVEVKPDRSPVTAADRGAERELRSRISAAYPDDGILGEEYGETRGRSRDRWIVDPVDGTRSFVHGVPLFGILIGMQREGDAVLGVVHFPALRETVYAARGLGAWWLPSNRPARARPVRARVSRVRDLSRSLLVFTCANSFDQARCARAFDRLRRSVGLERGWGDCYGHVLVATGRAEVMLDPIMNVWDCAALLPIVTEAGGTFTDWDGRPRIDGGSAISTNGHVQRQLMRLLADRSRDAGVRRSKRGAPPPSTSTAYGPIAAPAAPAARVEARAAGRSPRSRS